MLWHFVQSLHLPERLVRVVATAAQQGGITLPALGFAMPLSPHQQLNMIFHTA